MESAHVWRASININVEEKCFEAWRAVHSALADAVLTAKAFDEGGCVPEVIA